LPILRPVTEPAVGYGIAGGLSFFHTRPRVIDTPRGPRVLPPNVTAVAGLGTENGSWSAFAAHLHTWDEGRVRYVIGGGFASLNLDWFGRSDAFNGRAFSYNIEAFALAQKLTFKLGDSDFFAGPTQRFLATHSTFDGPGDLPRPGDIFGILPDELDTNVSGVGVTVGYDTRDSLFSPTRGTKASVSYTQNLEAIGSDLEYGGFDAEICQYVPLGGPFTLGLRLASTYSGDDAPFFDLGSVSLRGIQAGRYVDNAAFTAEAELRYDLSRRWTLVTFGGSGWVAADYGELFEDDEHYAVGAGFRYLVAREYDMRMGLDVARGEEDWAVYITVGTGWLRD
jgi:hypothetical protein